MDLKRGANWRKWDLQVQTILDDGYISLSSYYEKLKTDFASQWHKYIGLVGGEENALLFDSKKYFYDQSIPEKTRCLNYVRNLFAFVNTFNSEVGVIGITDHNYHNNILIDEFIEFSKSNDLKALAGIEINVSGVHMLVFFENAPYSKSSFSEGLKTFLSKINVHQPKTDSVLTVSPESVINVIDEITREKGIYVFPHCNSNNGLFQERGRTDRTHLADIFNYKKRIFLQSKTEDGASKTLGYIQSSPNLKSHPIFSISRDSRCLKDILKSDDAGNYTWIKADPTFEGLRQVLYEPDEKIRIQSNNPYSDVDKKYFSNISIQDNIYLFDDDNDLFLEKYTIPLNQGLVSIIGGRGEGKSMLIEYLSATFKKSFKSTYKPNSEFRIDYVKSSLSQERVTYSAASLDEDLDYLYVPQNELKEVTNPETPQKLKSHLFNLLGIEKSVFNSELEKKLSDSTKKLLDFKGWLMEQDDDGNYVNSKQRISEELKKVNKLLQNLSTTETETNLKEYTENLAEIQENLSELEKISNLKSDISDFDKSYSEKNQKLKRPILNFESDKYLKKLKSRERFYEASINKCKKKNFYIAQSIKSFYRGDIESLLQDSKRYQIKKSSLEKQIEDHRIKIKEAFDEKANLSQLINEIKVEYDKQISEIDTKWNEFGSTRFNTPEKKKIFSDLISSCGITIKGEILFDKREFYKELRNQINGTKWRTKNSDGVVEGHFQIGDFSTYLEFIQKRIIKEFKDRREYYYDTFLDFFLLNKNRSQYLKVIPVIYYKGKTLDKLSGGEKGTLYLRIKFATGLFNTPIVIDQPEDELDNLFITEELVSLLRRIRKYRQIILVTHNANIVVNSDSDQVIVAKNNGGQISYSCGSLENPEINNHICRILEGGKDAFKKRRNKYSAVD